MTPDGAGNPSALAPAGRAAATRRRGSSHHTVGVKHAGMVGRRAERDDRVAAVRLHRHVLVRVAADRPRILVDQHGGQVPVDIEALEALPGVGHKTASVVMVQAFGVPAFPVDTHIHRLAQMWEFTDGKNVKKTEADLKKLFPEDIWHDIHIQIILYGREMCPARGCDGLRCELCQHCFPGRKRPKRALKA